MVIINNCLLAFNTAQARSSNFKNTYMHSKTDMMPTGINMLIIHSHILYCKLEFIPTTQNFDRINIGELNLARKLKDNILANAFIILHSLYKVS